MSNLKLPIEDVLSIVFMLILFVTLIILCLRVIAGQFGTPEEEAIAVRDPVEHTMILVKPMKIVETPWAFKHCTPTNKDCGRLDYKHD